MMDGPHIFGFSPVALCINLTSALASARWVGSVMAPINAATLNLVGLVLLSAIPSAFRFFRRLTWLEETHTRSPATLYMPVLYSRPNGCAVRRLRYESTAKDNRLYRHERRRLHRHARW